MSTAKIITELRAELGEMKRLGLNVPSRAGWFVSANWPELQTMRETMTLAEVADYVCESAARIA